MLNLEKLIVLYQEESCNKNKNNLFKEIQKAMTQKMKTMSKNYERKYNFEYQDVKQTMSEMLFRACQSFDGTRGCSFKTYFYTIARRELNRLKNNHLDWIVIAKSCDYNDDIVETTENIDLGIDKQILLDKLNEEEILLLTDLYCNDMKNMDVAKKYNITPQNLQYKLKKISEKVRSILKEGN